MSISEVNTRAGNAAGVGNLQLTAEIVKHNEYRNYVGSFSFVPLFDFPKKNVWDNRDF